MLNGTRVNHILYADDLAIFAETREGLQTHLDRLSHFSRDKDLIVNEKKSVVMVFNKSGKTLRQNLIYNGKKLETVNRLTYLGIDLAASGTLSHGIRQLANKARKAMIQLYGTIIKFKIPFDKCKQLFNTYIEPILLYNSENWSTFTEKQIEKCKANSNIFYQLSLLLPASQN